MSWSDKNCQNTWHKPSCLIAMKWYANKWRCQGMLRGQKWPTPWSRPTSRTNPYYYHIGDRFSASISCRCLGALASPLPIAAEGYAVGKRSSTSHSYALRVRACAERHPCTLWVCPASARRIYWSVRWVPRASSSLFERLRKFWQNPSGGGQIHKIFKFLRRSKFLRGVKIWPTPNPLLG
jgi:hypothetical protein